jgi:uncharacterized protein (TIGR03382 family)
VTRVSRCRAAFVAIALATLVGAPRVASAYDSAYTHRWITRQAVAHLRALYPGQYDDILEHIESFVDGVEDEDNVLLDGDDDPTTLRVMRHFYRPTDNEGLTMEAFGHFPSSYDWAAVPNDQNEWGYDDALRYFQEGDTDKAYFAIGHVVHLIQDATVPAHTHLDAHGPPAGDSYEAWCSAQMRSEYDGDLAVPEPGAPLPVFVSLQDAWQKTAYTSYWRNMYPGSLSDVDTAQASGVLADMFPGIEVDWLSQNWSIPGVGKLGTAFWEYEPGYFYFKQAVGIGAIDRSNFVSTSPSDFAFADNLDQDVMTKLMADDLVPIAILHSAAMLKYFMDETRGLEVDPPGGDLVDPGDAGGCQTGGSSEGAAGLLVLAAIAMMFRRKGEN